MSASALTMFARISLVALAALTAGCLKDLSQVDTSTSGTTLTTDGPSTETNDPTATDTSKPVCGNGVVEGTEQCDDGNQTPGDGCEEDCTTTPGENCGDGVVDEGEECDDNNKIPGDGCENNCTKTMVSPSCGDGVVNGDDECDDNNDVNTDECTNTCKLAVCGDGIVQDGVEECDDNNGDDNDACTNSCKVAVCGDGIVQAGVEACDDGDANDDAAYEGCTTQCELGPRCGDGVLQGDEECDDGTPDGDDLCNACINTPRRYVFVTSATYTGNTTGVDGADITCGFTAIQAGIAGNNPKWVAWLSDSASPPLVSRVDTTYTGWYALPGDPDVPLAKGWSGLSSGALLNPPNRTETGETLAPGKLAWSNTKLDGQIFDANQHCNKWSSNSAALVGGVGDPHATDSQWTAKADPSTVSCDTPLHLYCVEN